jgi:nucleoside-diphosphate-sugar epimerase
MRYRYLITGAQGFIGRYLTAHLLVRFPKAVLLGLGRSRLQASKFCQFVACRDLDEDRYSYVSCDLASSDCTEIIRDFGPTTVIHLAASLRGESEENVFQNNVRSTEGLLNGIRSSKVKLRLLLVSSGGVYGNQQKLPIAETAPVRPLDLYSQSKLVSEDLARSFALESNTPLVIARVFNVLGPGQDELHFAGRMAGQIGAITSGRSAPPIRAGALSGTRDFLDVRDVCSALIAVMESKLEGICNIGSGVETNITDLLQLLIQAAGLPSTIPILQEKDRFNPILRHYANINQLAHTDFAPKYSLARSCQEMVEYAGSL